MTSKIRNGLIIFSFLLLSITIIGIFWLVTTPGAQAGLIFSYAAGLSIIVLAVVVARRIRKIKITTNKYD